MYTNIIRLDRDYLSEKTCLWRLKLIILFLNTCIAGEIDGEDQRNQIYQFMLGWNSLTKMPFTETHLYETHRKMKAKNVNIGFKKSSKKSLQTLFAEFV